MENQEEEIKPLVMYVLVRKDMRYENCAVQAVAEYLTKHQPFHKEVRWENVIMVYLSVKNEIELLSYARTLMANNHKFGMFVEPDWGTPQHTALATIAFRGEMFTELRTLKMPKGYFTWFGKYVYKIKRSLTDFVREIP